MEAKEFFKAHYQQTHKERIIHNVSPESAIHFAEAYYQHRIKTENLSIHGVDGQSEQLHLCPACNENAGKSYLLSKLPTICQKCDHAWNRA